MDKRRIVWGVLFLGFLAVCFMYLNSPVTAYRQGDFLRLLYNTDKCFVDCYAIVEVSNPTGDPIVLGDGNWETWYVWGEGANDLVGGLSFQILDDVEYVVVVPDYVNVTKSVKCSVAEKIPLSRRGWCYAMSGNSSNISGGGGVLVWSGDYDSFDAETNTFYYSAEECVGSHREIRVREGYVDFNPVGKRVAPGESYLIKIVGRKRPKLGSNNVDWRIRFLDNEPDWAWWNSSYTYRRNISCDEMDDNVPLVINGSGGFYLNGSKQIVWTFCSGTGTALYYNDCTDYVIANDTDQLPMEVELGNGTDYQGTDIWGGVNANLTQHTLQVDSSPCSNTISASGNPSATTGYIGDGIDFDGSDYLYVDDPTVEWTPRDLTIMMWIKTSDSTAYGLMSRYADSCKVWLNQITSGKFNFWLGSGNSISSSTSVNDNSWHFVASTYDSSSNHMRLFVDGRQESSDSGSPDGSGSCVLRMGFREYSGNYYTGVQDEVRMLNYVYTLDQINQTFQNAVGSVGFGDLGVLETEDSPPPPPPAGNVSGGVIRTSSGNLTLAPAGGLVLNVSGLSMMSSNGSWFCCGPSNGGTWNCETGRCD